MLKQALIKDEPLGDGKAAFIENGTEMEYIEYDRLENKGWKGFYKKVKNLGKKDETNKQQDTGEGDREEG